MPSRRLKDFDEALEAYRLGEDVEYASPEFMGNGSWKKVFRKDPNTPRSIIIDEDALGYCVNFRTKPQPRVEEILQEMFDNEPPGKGLKQWRSVKGAKKAVTEVIDEIALAACQGEIPTGKAMLKYFENLRRKYCGED